MAAKENPARGRAAGLSMRKIGVAHLHANSLNTQVRFTASRPPDRLIDVQPFWRVGQTDFLNSIGTHVHLEVAYTLCARCGVPFFFTTPCLSKAAYVTRRCVEHRRPGKPVRQFKTQWFAPEKRS